MIQGRMTELSLRHINERSALLESITLHLRIKEEGTLFDLVEFLTETVANKDSAKLLYESFRMGARSG